MCLPLRDFRVMIVACLRCLRQRFRWEGVLLCPLSQRCWLVQVQHFPMDRLGLRIPPHLLCLRLRVQLLLWLLLRSVTQTGLGGLTRCLSAWHPRVRFVILPCQQHCQTVLQPPLVRGQRLGSPRMSLL